MTAAFARGLSGLTVLVVEDDYHLAEELCLGLEDAGALVLGPAPSVAEALHLLAGQAPPDAAVLDVNLGREFSWPVIDALVARKVPVLLASGYDSTTFPMRYAGLPRCEKPFTVTQMATRLIRHLAETVES